MAIVTKGAAKIYCSGVEMCQQNIWHEESPLLLGNLLPSLLQ